MIDIITVFHKGGLILWSKHLNPVEGQPVDAVIKHVLIDEKAGGITSYQHNGVYTVKWLLANEFDLVFVIVYTHDIRLSFVDDLLRALHDAFVSTFREDIHLRKPTYAFDTQFESILRRMEQKSFERVPMKMRSYQETKRGSKIPSTTAPCKEKKTDESKIEPSASANFAKRASVFGEAPKVGDTYADGDLEGKRTETKDPIISKKDDGVLSRGMELFKAVAGKKTIEKDNITHALELFRTRLLTKNVATEIAEKLTASVSANLEGRTQPSFTTLQSCVKSALESTLTKILTPSRPRDILQEILLARESKRPYSIVFVGVNGVGKSTSLAKVAAYLLSKSFTVSMCACDTFRSGAVEQLQTHARALGISLFERGYKRDPASVAMEGILTARREGHDVVLIDTAGRMQGNENLMKALSKLINVNKPDLVLFVCEALVGNDAVDQVTQFNRSLTDLSVSTSTCHLIDGVILTKFDTVDDKVGAAISITYSTGIPILFVGVGQTYKDLRKPNVETLIRALLK